MLLYSSRCHRFYWSPDPKTPATHLVIPYTLDCNDMRFATPQGFNSGDQFYTYLKDTFDCLLREGSAGSPKMMSVGLHCRLVGRPGRALALERFLDYVASFGKQASWHASQSLSPFNKFFRPGLLAASISLVIGGK